MSNNFKQVRQSVGELKEDIKDNTSEALEEAGDDVARSLRVKIKKNGSDATGKLTDNLEATDVSRSSGKKYANIKITAPPHWAYLEFGTGIYSSRGYPAPDEGAPVGMIQQWIIASGITPDPDGPADNQEELANIIARSIKTGTRQHKFARPVWRGPRGAEHISNKLEWALENTI